MRNVYAIFFFVMIAIQADAQSRILPSPVSTETLSLKLYPNPASTQITFNFESGYDRNYSFQIFNFIGKKVFELHSVDPKTIVDLSYFYRGVYIFQVRDKNSKVVESGRFTIEK